MKTSLRLSKYFFLVSLLFFPLFLNSSTWTDGAANDNWTDVNNWDSGVPNGIGAEADFLTLGAAQTVAVDTGITVSQIHFNSTVNYMVNGPQALTVDVSSGRGQIVIDSANTGSHTIAANMQLNESLDKPIPII